MDFKSCPLLALLGLVLLLIPPARGAESDAIELERNLVERHLAPFGTIIDPFFQDQNDNTHIRAWENFSDSAIWTGYLAAAAYHYATSPSPEQLDRIRAALDGLRHLVNVTPGGGLLARFAIPVNDPRASPYCRFSSNVAPPDPVPTAESECTNAGGQWAKWGPVLPYTLLMEKGLYRGTDEGRDYFWIGRTSRDQYSGVFLGLSVAYEVVADDGVRATVKDLVNRLLYGLVRRNWGFTLDNSTAVLAPSVNTPITWVTNPLHVSGLLQVGRQVDPSTWTTWFLLSNPPGSESSEIGWESLDTYHSFYKFNLDFIHIFNLVRLETDRNRREDLWRRYGVLRSALVGTTTGFKENALFNLYDFVINGAATWTLCHSWGGFCPGFDFVRESSTWNMLNEFLSRPRRVGTVLNSQTAIAKCPAPNPAGLLHSPDKTMIACKPIPVGKRIQTDFLWQRSHQQLDAGGDGTLEPAGIDYLLPYWMGRYYHLWTD